jgi:hypothetical protein
MHRSCRKISTVTVYSRKKSPKNTLMSIISWNKFEDVIFFILISILLLPVFLVQYFPSQDGPIHRWLIHIMANYNKTDQTLLREFLVQNNTIEPNMGFYMITYPLYWLVNLHVAEKIFLSIYAFFFAYGVRYAIFSINKDATALSFLVIPTIFSYYIHFGFYNFQLGIALFFPALAYSILALKNNNSGSFWKIGAISTVLSIIHLVPFVIYVFVLGMFFIFYYAFDAINQRNVIKYLSSVAKKGAVLALWMMPSILIFISFARRHGVSETEKALPKYLLEDMIKLRFTQSYSTFETMFISMPLVFVIAVTMVISVRKIFKYSNQDKTPVAIFAAAFGLGLLYLFFPFSSKDVPLNPRLAPLLFLLVIMIISFVTPNRLNRLFLVSAISLIVCAQAIFRLDVYQAYNSRLKSLDSVQAVVRDSSTFLNVTFTDDNHVEIRGNPLHHTRRLYPMAHAGANAAIDRRSIYMRSSLMSRSIYGYFPYTYRNHMDPFQVIGDDIESLNPVIDINAFQISTGKPIDYIIITGLHFDTASATAHGEFAAFEEIARSYEHVASSADGWYHVYALRQDQSNDTP